MHRDDVGRTTYSVLSHTHTMVAVEHDGSYWPSDYEPKVDDDGYYLPDDQMDCMQFRVANAHLIAAAPELLEALDEAYAELSADSTRDGPRCLLLTKIEAAIAKARGQ